ncbi:MAG: DUF2318 domain-containing protein [Lachnospiraceae bacterium]|nr:DUF2318 domain-containing protein [Lachnospiraceae bacterium]
MKKFIESHNKWSTIAVVGMLLISILTGCSSSTDKSSPPSSETFADSGQATVSDLVIPIADITEIATFYPVEVDGVKLEVLAVKAPDGSIRTAFNTCQVCYDSGKGYYKQDGNVLVCQNCGNRFTMDKVEMQSGGCNPVPIFADNKTVDNEDITISADFLTESKGIFANWKPQY